MHPSLWLNEFTRTALAMRKEKRMARVAANNAARDGRLERPLQCEHCGGEGAVQMHHTNYAEPLTVVGLCQPCHAAEHRRLGTPSVVARMAPHV